MSIATKLAKLKTIKQDIKNALEEKGQTPSNVFSTYANNIRAIETGGITPSGELSITENGTYDVTNYASANVNVAGSGGSDLDSYIDGSITSLTSNATSVRNFCFYYSNLTSVNLPNATDIMPNSFMYCSKLVNVNIPNTQRIYGNAFSNCYKVESLYLPKLTNIYADYVFSSCTSLKEILIEQTTSICTLSNTNSFNNCYHFLGTKNTTYNPNGLKDGYIYVPASLLSQYKVETNWSTYASQIVGYQDYVVGDELINYSNETFTTCTWYSDKEMTIEVASVVSNGRYYCKLEA